MSRRPNGSEDAEPLIQAYRQIELELVNAKRFPHLGDRIGDLTEQLTALRRRIAMLPHVDSEGRSPD